MTARPTWVRKCYWALAILASLTALAVCYAYWEITAEVDPNAFKRPNELDAKEADRKLKLYTDALAISRRGFIRLSAVEINSYLQQHFFADSDESPDHAAPPAARLLNSRVELTHDGFIWCCWLRKEVWGRSTDLVWLRAFELKPHGPGSQLQPISMRVGRLEIPRRFWHFVEQQFGEVDRTFAGQEHWLAQLPTFEIKTNEASISPELRLFTYVVPRTSRRPRP